MRLIEIVYQTSPFSEEETRKILFDNNVNYDKTDFGEVCRMLYDEVSIGRVDYYAEEMCEFANEYIKSRKGPVFYRQVIRDKMEKWCLDMGKPLNMSDSEVEKLVKEYISVPIKE